MNPMRILGTLALMLAMSAQAMAADITVYRNDGCGCCGKWAAMLGAAGHKVTIVDGKDMSMIKTDAGVPEAMASCHTAMVDGYVVEGHVPIADIERMLEERPAIKGLAVPGMPIGSPGMEAEDGTSERYDVMAIAKDGSTTVYASH